MIPSEQVDKDIRQGGVRAVARRALGRAASARARTGEKGSGLGAASPWRFLGATLWGVNRHAVEGAHGSLRGGHAVVCVREELTACWLFLAMGYATSPHRLRGVLHDGRSLLSIAGIAIGSILFSQVAYLEAIDWTTPPPQRSCRA
jgi:hypothetical protein